MTKNVACKQTSFLYFLPEIVCVRELVNFDVRTAGTAGTAARREIQKGKFHYP